MTKKICQNVSHTVVSHIDIHHKKCQSSVTDWFNTYQTNRILP